MPENLVPEKEKPNSCYHCQGSCKGDSRFIFFSDRLILSLGPKRSRRRVPACLLSCVCQRFFHAVQQRMIKLLHGLITVWRRNRQALHQDLFCACRDYCSDCTGRDDLIFDASFNRVRWYSSGNSVIVGCRHGIDIGIRPLPSTSGILLFRCEAVLQNHIQAFALLSAAVASRAKID